ncbi:MAG: hypothetical protein CL947_04820 [Epsilonproteobacteria bacterium]|nr:hypothetical protein [Campylobacterota bacterium]|tara:strand:+ start:1477 stop:2550 length:1074 start_codon:yes stop_codon:yes gene_type:complete
MSKRLGVVFPGYGEQFIGMGKDLYDEFRIVQEFFEQAAGATDKNFVKLSFASSDEEISSTRYAYLAIYLFECSLYELLYQKGLRPDFIAGYGIGEYTACFAARSLSFIDGLYFLNKYSQFYHDFLQHHKDYTVLKITRDFTTEKLQEIIDASVTKTLPAYIAAQNTQNGFFVAGAKRAIAKIEKFCKENVIRKVKEVGPQYGLHSELMNPIVDQLKLYYHKIQFKKLQVPVITNVDGVYVTTPDSLQSAVMRRINNRINWHEVITGFEGCDVIVSVGPGKQLIEWFKEVYPDKEYHIVSSMKDIDAISDLFEEVEQAEETVKKEISEDLQVKKKEKDLLDADLVNERPSDYDDDNDK